MPIRRRISAASRSQLRPRTSTSPDVASRIPSMISMVVVLPAPFGPSRPKHSPVRTSRSRPRTASTGGRPGYVFTRFRQRMACDIARPRRAGWRRRIDTEGSGRVEVRAGSPRRLTQYLAELFESLRCFRSAGQFRRAVAHPVRCPGRQLPAAVQEHDRHHPVAEYNHLPEPIDEYVALSCAEYPRDPATLIFHRRCGVEPHWRQATEVVGRSEVVANAQRTGGPVE